MNTDHPPDPTQPDISAYVDQAAALLALPLSPEHRAGVVANLTQLHAIAGPLMGFAVDETTEAAPVFAP